MSIVGRLAWSRWSATFAAAAVAGIALRIWVYRSVLGVPNSDEAIVGLMTQHSSHGHLSTFYWGQAYGGSQEVLLAVPGFLIAGSSWLALRIVPLALFLAGLVLVWRIGVRTIGERGGAAAAALYWIWPPWMIYELTHEWGFYGSDVVYCGLLLLLGLRIVERPERARIALFGLVLGLGFWETSQIVPIAVAVVGWVLWKQPRCFRQSWVALPPAVLGALPWLIWNLLHHWGSLSLPSGASSSYEFRLRVFVSPVLPMMLGLRTPFSQSPLGPAVLADAVYGGLLLLFAFGAYRARRQTASLLYVVAAVYPFIYGLAAQTFNASDPRYLAALTPVLVLIVAQSMTSWLRGTLVLVVAGALSVLTLHRMEPLPNDLTAGAPIAPRSLAPLIATLDRLHLDRVYTQYWLSYVLDFDTRERIIAVENKFLHVSFVDGQAVLPDVPVRYLPYEKDVKAGRHGIVLFRRGIASIPIVPELLRHGYREIPTGPFIVFAPPR